MGNLESSELSKPPKSSDESSESCDESSESSDESSQSSDESSESYNESSDSSSENFESSDQSSVRCTHYENKCKLICPKSNCRKRYPCRRCHDEHERGHRLDRYNVENIVCNNCATEQEVTIVCIECETIFGKYFCQICNLFDDQDLGYYHCHGCRECRTGGPDNHFHCFKCNTCLSLAILYSHKCVQDATMNNCPICLDDMNKSDQPTVTMPCGHEIHKSCYQKLQASAHSDTCPMCRRPI